MDALRVLLALGLTLGGVVACDDGDGDGDGGDFAPGTERGPCDVGDRCDEGLTCLSDICVRVPDGGPGEIVDADVGAPDADLSAVRTYYDDFVKPIVELRCASCHGAGGGGAPGFGTSFDTVVGYDGPRGPLVGCTLTQSLLLAQGAHTGPVLLAAEQTNVRQFLELYASLEPSCAATAGARPRTGPLHADVPMYNMDLSTMGQGLLGASMSFNVVTVPGGLELTDITLVNQTTNGQGLLVVGPVPEFCRAGVLTEATEFETLHTVVPSGATVTLGDGALALPGAATSDLFAIGFLVLRPYAPAASPPGDVGGACIP